MVLNHFFSKHILRFQLHFVRKGLLSLVLLLMTAFTFNQAHARDLHGRIGIGFNNEFSSKDLLGGGAPAISLKYGITKELAAQMVFGVNTTPPSTSVVGVKFTNNLIMETNLNFNFFVAGGLISAKQVSSAEFLGGFGAEFFIPGIDSLGFGTSIGVSLNNLAGSFAFKTLGLSFINAGVHFYF